MFIFYFLKQAIRADQQVKLQFAKYVDILKFVTMLQRYEIAVSEINWFDLNVNLQQKNILKFVTTLQRYEFAVSKINLIWFERKFTTGKQDR